MELRALDEATRPSQLADLISISKFLSFMAPFGMETAVVNAVVKPPFVKAHLMNFIHIYAQLEEVAYVGIHE